VKDEKEFIIDNEETSKTIVLIGNEPLSKDTGKLGKDILDEVTMTELPRYCNSIREPANLFASL
jgi:hypothetical protein